ncbi:hypothetical protein V1460_30480 [Streptomyces sp. SCSIO 30461]|uniref:hypothetical protein n=1 Tax=Streptomyces sp. SCSIO 30461 TaxID=3118085 RepID=UPI0030D22429
MHAPTPDALRTAGETLAHLTEYLRERPDLDEALDLVEPLLDEYTGLPIQLGEVLRALARVALDHATVRTPEFHRLIADLREAAWEQTDQHALHYQLDRLRSLLATAEG